VSRRLSALVCTGALCALSLSAAGADGRGRSGRDAKHRLACEHARRHGRHARRCPVRHHGARKPSTPPAVPERSTTGVASLPSLAGVPPVVGPGSPEAVGETEPGAGVEGGSAEAPGEAAGGPAHVQVTAEDTEAFRFVLSRPSVPEGEVVIEFVNHGQDEHNLNAVGQAEGNAVGSIPDTAPGAHPSITLDMKAGSYTLFCSLPGHEAKGMKATLRVE
jgi:plastocyanin